MDHLRPFNRLVSILKAMLIADAAFLLLMSFFRGVFFYRFADVDQLTGFWSDVAHAFFLGIRFDLTVIGYIQLLATLILLAVYRFKHHATFRFINIFFVFYYFSMFTLASLLLASDFGFYSYFQDHINILIFGIMDDDTVALWSTLLKNYNVPLIVGLFLLYEGILLVLLVKLFKKKFHTFWNLSTAAQAGIILLFLVLNTLAARGGVSMYPLGIMDTAISNNMFVNKLSINGVHTFYRALELRVKNKSGRYDLIKQMGYKGRIDDAFRVHLGKEEINEKELISNITYRLEQNATIERVQPHVVVIMMESFGSFLSEFQSPKFNVLGSLEKHFKEDILFKNFTSTDNGTIGSLESLVVALPFRPGSDHFAENEYLRTSFRSSPAFLYKEKGYETSLLYGGNVGWRDIDKFFSRQGFDHIYGDHEIESIIPDKSKKYKDDWGVFDEYLFDFIEAKLRNATAPQFMIVMTTTNHPPYVIQEDYRPKPLEIPAKLEKRVTGERDLVRARFRAYQYANEQAGKLLDSIKSSPLKEKTVVAITGDHNFGNMISFSTEEYMKFRGVPFYLYLPEQLRPKTYDDRVFGSHKDIFPTLYPLTLSDTEYIAIGQNMFDKRRAHVAFNASGLAASKEGAVFAFEPVSYFIWEKGRLKRVSKTAQTEKILEYYRATESITEFFVRSHLAKE